MSIVLILVGSLIGDNLFSKKTAAEHALVRSAAAMCLGL